METKLLYTIGNIYTGYPWGVEAEQQFGSKELHGPFNSENTANTYMHELVEGPKPTSGPYVGVKIVRIETPQAGRRIVRSADGGYEYAV